MTEVNHSLSVITLNVNRLLSNQKIETGRMDKNTKSNYMLSLRDSLQNPKTKIDGK